MRWEGYEEKWLGRHQVTCPSGNDVTYTVGVLELRGVGWSLPACGRYLKPGKWIRSRGYPEETRSRSSLWDSQHAELVELSMRL